MPPRLPPGQQWIAADKWPTIGERLPRRDAAPWTLRVEGLVEQPCSISLEELARLPQVERTLDIHCVTRWSKPDVRFGGVPLRALLERVRPAQQAKFISFIARSERGHSTSLELSVAWQLDPLVALQADGRPLAEARGGPLRLVVPGRYFYKSLKWLERIELLAEDRLGFWESTAGYHNLADPWREQRYLAPGLSKSEAQAILARRDISGRDLLGLAAPGFELEGLKAERALLRNADFRHARLRGACFDGGNLSNAHFDGCDLQGASFVGADLEGADFSGADLRGVSLLGASLFGASFCRDFDAASGSAREGAQIDAGTRIDPAALGDLLPLARDYLMHMLRGIEGRA